MITSRYGSVWDALEDMPGAVEDMKIRSTLVQDLAARISLSGTPLAEAAERFGVTQLRITDLMDGRIDTFSIDTLVRMLATAGLHLDVQVRDATIHGATPGATQYAV